MFGDSLNGGQLNFAPGIYATGLTANVSVNNNGTAGIGITTMGTGGAFTNQRFVGGMQVAGGQYDLGQSSVVGTLWGPKRDLDYWTACREGLVPEPERRAMRLFASECDEERFSLYCHIGTVAALGNMTRHLYIVRRYSTVCELGDGKPVQNWCVVTRDRHLIPETDHVMAMKSLIEGEEYSFRATGNRVGAYLEKAKFQDPYRDSFLKDAPRSRTGDVSDWESLPKTINTMKIRLWLSHHAWIEKWKRKIEPFKQMSREEFELAELRNRLLQGVGAEYVDPAHAF